ncbi:MAG: SOS response-associated peptidase [Acidimicrobiales bacterium]
MCGRFVAASPPDEIARFFNAETPEVRLEPSYNVAPGNDVYAVLEEGEHRRLEPLHWGLVPRWARDPSVGNRLINARAETLAEKNAFKDAFRKRRCLIPADGFYEWRREPGKKAKQPYFIRRRDGEPMAFAGLWEFWRSAGAPEDGLRSCCIITGEANEKVRPVHDRMPIILPPSAWDAWLDPNEDDLELLGRLLVPAPASLIELYPVSTDVNNVRNDGRRLIEPIETQGTLL